MLTASGFSIITGMRRLAQASTTARWSNVFVNAATASGLDWSSMASSDSNINERSSLNCFA